METYTLVTSLTHPKGKSCLRLGKRTPGFRVDCKSYKLSCISIQNEGLSHGRTLLEAQSTPEQDCWSSPCVHVLPDNQTVCRNLPKTAIIQLVNWYWWRFWKTCKGGCWLIHIGWGMIMNKGITEVYCAGLPSLLKEAIRIQQRPFSRKEPSASRVQNKHYCTRERFQLPQQITCLPLDE